MLSKHIKSFFQALTDNEQVIDLALAIQDGLEKGNTAIASNKLIQDKVISSDGKSGYIVQKDNLTGFRRFFTQEQSIANDFKQIQLIENNQEDVNKAIDHTCQTLKIEAPTEHDKQWQASLNFLKYSRYILSGGPGTGKTTCVVRMLLIYAYLNPTAKIAMAAPTGKAANRMMQSLNSQLPEQHQQIAQTLHRLLGYNHQKNSVKYQQNNPLPYDLVIIDEASMLDVTLTYRLIQALKPTAQLLLIGDKNQLPAVEAGNVYANLCSLAAENFIELTTNYRFSQDSQIAKLCSSLINQDVDQFHLANSNHSNPKSNQEKQQYLEKWYQQVGTQSSMVLSPVKHGNNSTTQLNELAVKILYNAKPHKQGMPIIVNQNDYTLGIFNGDIGYMEYIDSQWQILFTIEGKQTNLKLDAIKGWQVAHAITIHKAQGSEYDHVLIVIPDDSELEILTNQLLYTAISRAKKSVTIWSSKAILQKIIKTQEKRVTFLK